MATKKKSIFNIFTLTSRLYKRLPKNRAVRVILFALLFGLVGVGTLFITHAYPYNDQALLVIQVNGLSYGNYTQVIANPAAGSCGTSFSAYDDQYGTSCYGGYGSYGNPPPINTTLSWASSGYLGAYIASGYTYCNSGGCTSSALGESIAININPGERGDLTINYKRVPGVALPTTPGQRILNIPFH